jgi:uncharacterized protein (TIGR02246 family)
MKQLVLRWAVLGCLAGGLWIGIVAAAQDCKTSPSDRDAIVRSVQAMYAAAMADDRAKVASYFAPGFYMFDGGARFDGDAIMNVIEAQRAKGYVYVWNVTKPDVHVHCDDAWIAYVNDGSVKLPGAAAPTPMQWLESVVLERQNGVWKMVFFQSTRVPR